MRSHHPHNVGRAAAWTHTVGSPLACPHTESPTAELVDQYHARYMKALEDLYNKYKDEYAKDRRHEMRFVH